MTTPYGIDSQPLAVESLPLWGQHLIEASAGTGKTFNITRIYLRLLLEKQLTVQQILVMTFTRAATQELKGRIRKEIQTALNNWGSFPADDVFYQAMQTRFTLSQIKPILHNALLHIDEASIFTIHGFCSRVLSEQAFASGLQFTMQMEANTKELELNAVRDYYRIIAKTSPNQFELLSNKWPSPESFYSAFATTLSESTQLTTTDINALSAQFVAEKQRLLSLLTDNQDKIWQAVIISHKDQIKREQEWQDLVSWLADSSITKLPKAAKDFLNGNRWRKEENKQLVSDALLFKQSCDDMVTSIDQSQVYCQAFAAIGAIRKQITSDKKHQQVMNFDDLITCLEDCVVNGDNSEINLSQLLREQHPAALIDEFQDTDPQQYNILTAIYGQHCVEEDGFAIYMIGDPKQAIYGFRGGDIFAYLAARNDAEFSWRMDTNWRSSETMVTGYNRLFYGQDLSEEDHDISVFNYNIDYKPVKAAKKNNAQGLQDQSNAKALEFVYFPEHQEFCASQKDQSANLATFRPVIANWCASEIQRLLTNNTTIEEQPLQEQDIAVLVRNGTEAQEVKNALSQAGYASVYLSDKENLFASEQAKDLYIVLDGIISQEDPRKFNAALSTRYLGGTSELLYKIREDEAAWEQAKQTLQHLKELWQFRGFMAMALKIVHEHYIPEPDAHERAMTNTLHLLELLQVASTKHQQPRQLLHYLNQQIEQEFTDSTAELRLESDQNLIKIITQHGCKGLEYPIVFVPFASRYSDPCRFKQQLLDIHKFHDIETGKTNKQLGHDERGVKLARQEGIAESVRLLYVAITRAQYRCYVCATPFALAENSPLGKTLNLNNIQELQTQLTQVAASEPNAIGLTCVSDIEFNLNSSTNSEVKQELVTAQQFHGTIERNWWLSSFSALTRNVRHGGSISQPERIDDQLSSSANDTLNAQPEELRFAIKKGADTGNLLHDILERLDFAAPHFQSACEKLLARFADFPEHYAVNDLYHWLEDILTAELPKPINDTSPKKEFELTAPNNEEEQHIELSLGDLSSANVLKETEFYFPMTDTNLISLGKLLAKYRCGSANISLLSLPGRQIIQGMMHGFIDLIFCWQGKYYLGDYKSTHLGNKLEDYHPNHLQENIESSFYDLQYLIYALALHRYLKQKLPNYQVEQHFGGVYYLYLRGMKPGSNTGVYSKHISAQLLTELDSVFIGESLSEGAHNV